MAKRFPLLALFTVLLLMPAGADAVDPACGLGPAPECDGLCAPGATCFDPGGGCMCVPSGGDLCGAFAGPPACAGDCPPGEACVDNTVTGCECVLTCGDAATPTCDGLCPPGAGCVDMGGFCGCVPAAPPCAATGPPACGGECPPFAPLCLDTGGGCACAVPTLSQWGLIGMSGLMLGSVLYLRRRRVRA